MATDPICGMFVREGPEALQTRRDARTVYFCSDTCKLTFDQPEKEARWLRNATILSWVAGAVTLAIMFGPRLPFEAAADHARMTARNWALLAVATPVQFWAGGRFYRGLWHAVRQRAANMDTLIAMGTSAAYGYSAAIVVAQGGLGLDTYFDVSVFVIAFILLGRTLEHNMKGRATSALRRLMDLRPRTARRVVDGAIQEVPVEALQVGDRFIVRASERVATDGRVAEGRSAVDESMVTGESMPVAKQVGDPVVGGTINTSGQLLVEATRIGQDTALAQIATLVERAQTGRAPIQRLVDAVSAWFVPLVIVTALASFALWATVGAYAPSRALLPAIAVLIIACPCALGLATPAALLVAVGRGAENGLLVKETDQLEALARVDTVVFDKTGTLTQGRHRVTDVVPAPGPGEKEVLRIAAAAEAGSTHPLAAAIIAEAKAKGAKSPPATQFHEEAGNGVRALVEDQLVVVGTAPWLTTNRVPADGLAHERERLEQEGKSVLHVARGSQLIGLVALADEAKEGAKDAIKALLAQRVEVLMVTGDNHRTAEAIAQQLGIQRVQARVLPAEKVQVVEKLRQEGHRVAMVGDGVNDAPALAAANVGIALGGGTDVAKEAGGLVLLKDDPRDVANAVQLARKSMSKIRQNLFWAFIYNVALVPVAAFDLLHPIMAGAAMGLSSFTVVGNSLLLRRYQPVLVARSGRGARQRDDAPPGAAPSIGDAWPPAGTDPVCGMKADPATARWTSVYQGRPVGFCSPGCKAEFDRDPEAVRRSGKTRSMSAPSLLKLGR